MALITDRDLSWGMSHHWGIRENYGNAKATGQRACFGVAAWARWRRCDMTIAPSTWYGPRSVAQAANSALALPGQPAALWGPLNVDEIEEARPRRGWVDFTAPAQR